MKRSLQESSAVDRRPGAEFRALADALPHLVWTARRDGTVEYLNKRWIEYTGVTLADLEARGGDVGVVHPDDVDEAWSRWNAALATGTPYEIEYRLRRCSDGSYHWFLSRAVPVRDAADNVTHWIGTATDIDDQRRARDTLAFMVDVSHALATAPDGPGDFWKSMRRIAEMITGEIADGCIVARVENNTLRFEAVVARDADVRATLARLEGKRPLRLDAERRFVDMLESRQAMRTTADLGLAPENAWPHLREAIDVVNRASTLIAPLRTGATLYGALVALYPRRSRGDREDYSLLGEIAARASLTAGRAEVLERERRIATTLQQASLPTLIPQVAGIHLNAVYAPAGDEAEVGGDWYDAIELDDGSLVVSVGDVTGRGIQAAAIMSKVRHAMGMAPRHVPDPSKILDSAEWFLRKRYPDAIVTAFVAIVSPDRRTLRFANAGHPRPLLRRNGSLFELEASGLPLGLRHLGRSEPSQSIDVYDGDVLTLFTDGLVEWSRDWADGERRLHDILTTSAVTASTASARLIERSCLPAKPHDDVAILTVSIGNLPCWSFSAEDARTAADARQQFVAFLTTIRSDAAWLARAELTFGELLGNVVRYAPGPVEINVFNKMDRIELHVLDSGLPFELANALPDTFSEVGRGLFIIQQIATSMCVEHIPNVGNHISVGLDSA